VKLHDAQQLALKVMAELLPFCRKIEIAGSVRRERSNVNDLDLVLIPNPGGDIPKIIARCERTMKMVTGRRSNPNNITFFNKELDVRLDLFFARGEIVDLLSTTPTNWGAVFLCRTGSMQHNIQLCSHAIMKRLKFAPYRGVLDGDKVIASATEEEIYGALGLAWRDPREREALK